MKPILESLAHHLISTEGSRLGTLRIILPNRRAGIFLQHHLARHTGQVHWAPKICSMGDFIQEISLLRSSDPVELLFTCFEIYASMVPEPDPFDEFFFWGEMMIRDFDELDKYMVDAEMLFGNIIDLRELEEPLAGLGPAQMRFLRQFWEGFHEGGESEEKKKFLESWKRLPLIYARLREDISSRGEGYQGMQYREIAERIGRGELDLPDADRTVIAGFNALSQSERVIFNWLKGQRARFFWDHDQSYTHEKKSEAGRFIRDNLVNFPPHAELEDFRGMEGKKEIRIFELPSDILQAKTVHRILLEEGADPAGECTETALVLCDEELLMPVVTSLPAAVQEVNVTMGYPMRNTPAFTLIDALVRLQLNSRKAEGEQPQFYHRDVTTILLHPLVRSDGDQSDRTILDEITRRNLVMVDQSFFRGELGEKVFRRVGTAGEMATYFKGVYLQILEDHQEDTEGLHARMDREAIFLVLRYLNRLEPLMAERPWINTVMVGRLLQKMLSVQRLHFEGEPLSGLQIMGILETRLLDFRHVIMLSVNEDVIPASHPKPSFIPYSMRMAYGMPAKEENDAIQAYYFQRLLQRAEKVDLIYNSASEGVRTGEMSRYLQQLYFGGRARIHRPTMEISAREILPLSMEHGPEVRKTLDRYTGDGTETRYLSPTAINTYLDCSLRFYLRYIAGIGEPDEVKEEIDAPGFGTVVHETIRLLYSQISRQGNGLISPESLDRLILSPEPERVLRQVFLEHQFRSRRGSRIQGRDIIVIRVMLHHLLKIMQTDRKIAPLEVVSLEEPYMRKSLIRTAAGEIEVLLGGKVDRVDRVGGIIRVIDYKTGDAGMQFPSLDSLFNPTLSNRNGAALQTLFYAWLVKPLHPGEQILPGLYVMKTLYGAQFDPALTMGGRGEKTRIGDFRSLETSFEELLAETLETLFNPAVPFTQTGQRTRCRSCPFAAICSRGAID